MSSSREIEHRSASACTFHPATAILTPSQWRLSASSESEEFASLLDRGEDHDDDDSNNKAITVKCTASAEGSTIRVSPMEKSRGGWDEEHFHERLRVPEGSVVGRGMVVMLEGIGRECLAIALSPYHSYDLGKTYVVHFGANGNLQTVLRRHVNYTDAVDVSFPSRVCAENKWVSYWVVLQGGKLSAGVGKVPGKNCIGMLDDSMYNMLRSGVDAVRYVGIGNSALQRNARDVRVRNVMVMPIPEHFGLGGIPMEESGFVNVLEMGDGENDAPQSQYGPTDAELLAEYEKERAKARARAAKFGIEYKEPAPDAFMKWSEARRLRANPERGFITGIDTFSMEEKAKADARKERFAREERKRKELHADIVDDEEGMRVEDGEEEMDEEDGADDVAEWEKTKRDPLAIEQAWDNWELVKQFRVDPPSSLAKVGGTELRLSDSFSNDVWHGHGDVVDSTEKSAEKEEFIPKPVSVVPTKIHVFSIDWACFKQVRTEDLMSYFKDYGPSYVEWLGELSCNVLFEDKFSAARAFHALSQELPSPPPAELISARKNGRVSGETDDKDNVEEAKEREAEIDKDMNETTDDGDGAADDVILPNASEVEADGIAVDIATEGGTKQPEETKVLPDYGGMGWRFCKWTVRKVSNDRYGRRGTRARVLMRLATSNDVLDDRPTEWPKPPPGFTTKRKLMPWYDFSGNRRRARDSRRDTKRRRHEGRRRERGDEHDHDINYTNDEEHPLLSKGLRCGRDGYSIEEIEAERMAKM
ncbi:hypothetical protein HJC23_010001 [Cyclotella cryptica]|uniref:Farnesoic acid O-methyl transferase domain-containing protein n=1 Tax=Cyclotella cryptica TaxID=29204 RepID=A0ABD3QB07_9STRA|eukprot:CCRYP_007788-RA/>CCRYP_007788-RA protein AED:0.06 eAED:0.06 QI:68/1/1/1/1/1/3/83/759